MGSADGRVSPWDGVRSFEARNIMRDKMKMGDEVLFYHSNCKMPGVFAVAKVVKEGYPDCEWGLVRYADGRYVVGPVSAWAGRWADP